MGQKLDEWCCRIRRPERDCTSLGPKVDNRIMWVLGKSCGCSQFGWHFADDRASTGVLIFEIATVAKQSINPMDQIHDDWKQSFLPVANRGEKEMVRQELHVIYFNVVFQLMKLYARVIIYIHIFLLCHSKILVVVQPLYGPELSSVVRAWA
jgi:hypothetical protein